MEQHDNTIRQLVGQMPPITLEEMSAIRLMNRTDTKFVTDITTLQRLLALARDSYYVQETCGKRISPYSTTYWDEALRHEMFRSHLCGHSPRTKIRVRTYLDSNVTFLEVKRKNNHGKTNKQRIPVPSLQAVIDENVGEEFLLRMTGYSYADLRPTLGNRFHRITLVNYDKTERLTIDFDLSFHNFETERDAAMDNIAIIELKRDGRAASPILSLLRELRIKPAGFSKYCIGSAITNADLRQNRFKPRLRKIDKIAQRTDIARA